MNGRLQEEFILLVLTLTYIMVRPYRESVDEAKEKLVKLRMMASYLPT